MFVKISFDPMMSTLVCDNAKNFNFWNLKEGNAFLRVVYKKQLERIIQGQVIIMTAKINGRILAEDFQNITKFKAMSVDTRDDAVCGATVNVVLQPVLEAKV